MADRYMDFDAAIIEEGKPPVSFTIGGRDYELPADMPAAVVLSQMRNSNEDGDMSSAGVSDWLSSLVGPQNLQQMLDDNVTWDQLSTLLSWLMGEYGLTSTDDADADAEDGDSPN